MNHGRTAASVTALLAFPEISFGTAASASAGAVPNTIRAKLPSFENQSGQALKFVTELFEFVFLLPMVHALCKVSRGVT